MALALITINNPPMLVPTFTDYSYVTWNPSTPASDAQWFATWDTPTSAPLPSTHANVQVLADGSKITLSWPDPFGSVQTALPVGPVNLEQIMTVLYDDTARDITADQYQEYVNNTWEGQGQPTLRQAIQDRGGGALFGLELTGLGSVHIDIP